MNKNNRNIILVLALLAAGFAGLYAYNAGYLNSIISGPVKYQWQKGMCYATWNKTRLSSAESDASIKELKRIGAEWIALIPNWYQDKCYTTKIYRTVNTATDESMVHAIKTAHSLGMKVMMKPHLDLIDTSGGSWRGEITCASDPDWQAWFESYRDFILHYAKMAEANGVEIFCMGTELTSVATIKESMWKEIVIKPLRQVYKGPMTYAANWNEEYKHVKFWDVLDYIGIDAYFPLTEKSKPSMAEIKAGWEPWVKELEAFQKTVKKPVIFPEVGYCSAEGTARAPWEDLSGGRLDLKQQEECYKALYEIFWDKEWFYGMYWWRWGTSVEMGGRNNRGFLPQNKPAQDVVAVWYAKPTPVRDFAEFTKKQSGDQ